MHRENKVYGFVEVEISNRVVSAAFRRPPDEPENRCFVQGEQAAIGKGAPAQQAWSAGTARRAGTLSRASKPRRPPPHRAAWPGPRGRVPRRLRALLRAGLQAERCQSFRRTLCLRASRSTSQRGVWTPSACRHSVCRPLTSGRRRSTAVTIDHGN